MRSNQALVVYTIVAKGGEPWVPTFRVLDIRFSEDASVRFADLPSRTSSWSAQDGSQLGIYSFYALRSEYSLEQRRHMTVSLKQAYDAPSGFVQA